MNSIKRINLTHVARCDQSWAKMTPTEKGRICQKCSKTIIDFRKMSDKEVAETHAFSNEAVCGIYKKRQLSLPKPHYAKKGISRWRSFFLGLLGLVYVQNASSQTVKNFNRTVQLEGNVESESEELDVPRESTQEADSSQIIISGKLLDENEEPAVAAVVLVLVEGDILTGVNTDENGFYKIYLTDIFKGVSKIELKFQYLSAEKTFIISKKDIKNGHANFDATLEDTSIEGLVFYVPRYRTEFLRKTWSGTKIFFENGREVYRHQ